MKREEIVHIAITKDQMDQILRMMKEKMTEEGKGYTKSSFLREFAIEPLLNGGSPPSQETVIEPSIENKDDDGWDHLKI